MGFNQTSGFTQRVAEVVTSLRPIEMRANMNKEKIVESKIGLNIKQLRKAQRITQKDLAAKIGTIEQTISKIERGVFTLSVETIMQFCNALNVTPNELRIDNPEMQKWHSNRLEHQEYSLNGLVDQITLVQNIFAKAELVHDDGDDQKERAYLDDIIQMYAWQTNDTLAIAQ